MKKEMLIIKKEDIKPLLYFIIAMFQQENTHRQGTSAKSDLIGGFIDRWINKIPEDMIFNKFLLKDKPYSAINDYFVYGAQSEKNAPDILGLKLNDRIIKFAEYDSNKWVRIAGMPHIEIKTFRKNQKLVSVRDTQLKDDDYYMFIEADFAVDYLVAMFEDECFNEQIREKIQMDCTFIKENSSGVLLQPPKINKNKDDMLGTLAVLTVIKGSDFKKKATLCESSEDVYYLKNIEEASRVTSPNRDCYFNDMFLYNPDIDMYNTTWNGSKTISMYATNVKKLKILKVNKKNFYCRPEENCSIYNFKLEANKLYKVDIEIFERSSKWNEYVALKNQFTDEMDRTSELIALFDALILK